MKTVNPHQDLLTLEPFRVPKDIEGEIWRDISGYEGFYQVSNLGRVKSLQNRGLLQRILSPLLNRGYLCVNLSKQSIRKQVKIHRLVAEAFIPNPKSKPEVNHINGIKSDNRVENLEWCTGSENMRHAYATNLKTNAQGEKSCRSKLSNDEVLYIRENPQNLSCSKLGYMFGIHPVTVSGIQIGKTYKTSGGNFRVPLDPYAKKLSDDICHEIQRIFVKGDKEFGAKALGKKFGVSQNCILRIVKENL